jgi:hypothetical protein
VDTPVRTDRKLKDLPLPRLQLTWRPTPKDEYSWACDYELLVPLSKFDIRNNGKRGKVGGGPGYIKASIGGTRAGYNGGRGPLTSVADPSYTSGTRFELDTPFRDGSHAAWDSFRLGFPAYVVLEQDGKLYTQHVPPREP